MAEDRKSYVKRWRRTNAQIASLIEDNDHSENETDNFIIAGENLNEDETNTIEEIDRTSDVIDDISNSDNVSFASSQSSVPDDATYMSSDSFEDSDLYISDSETEIVTLDSELAEWQSKHKLTRDAINDLLIILRRQGHRLPKDYRTPMKTPRQIECSRLCGGDYLYFGVESGLLKILSQHVAKFSGERLCISFNIDSVSLFKSTKTQLWPILCSLKGFEPFIVALFCGNSKPDSLDNYLRDFIEELLGLTQNGLLYNGETFRVDISAFVCDAPARSFLKCIKPFNSYYGCKTCIIKGRWENRVVFSSDRLHALRTDESFNNFEYKEHQTRLSPLVEVGVSCVNGFPLDYMHLVCLGVVKRILMFYKQGPRECRLSQQQLSILSNNLVE